MAKDNKWFKTNSSPGVFTGTREVAIDTGGSSGTANVLTGNETWVDALNGNDGTGTAGRADLPFLTIGAAITASSSGDSVIVRPGTYAESQLLLKVNMTLIGEGGYETTFITGATTTGTRVILNAGSTIINFTITIPLNGSYAIEWEGPEVAGARFIKFNGQANALGSGLANLGSGKLIAFEIRYGVSDCENVLLCKNGILAMQSLHIPGTGTIQRGAKVINGRLQALDMNIGNPNVIYGVEVGTAGTAVLISLNLFNLKNGILLSADDVQLDALGGKIQTTSTVGGDYVSGINSFTGRAIVVALGVNLASSVVRVTAQMEPNFVWDNTANPNAAGSDFTVNLIQSNTTERDASQRLFGTDSQIGFPERGSQFMTGEGGANATFNKVVTLDTTGAFIGDISGEAASKTGPGFTFASVMVDESIAWCSVRRDATGDLVKNWGLILSQVARAAGPDAIYKFEVYTGAAYPANYQPGVWKEVGVQAISVKEQYNYADDVFLRSGSEEQLRLGIDNDTTWNITEIDGVQGYYARVRIANKGLMTVTPLFQQLKTTPSHSMFNAQGQKTSHGLAMWRNTLFGSGNMWGEGNGTGNTDLNGATNGFSSTKFKLKNKSSRINGTGDYMTFQFAIPGGLCTAHPLNFKVLYSTMASSNLIEATFTLNLVPLKIENTMVADPTGGAISPIGRDIANTDDYGLVVPLTTVLLDQVVTPNKLRALTFGPYDISDYYEDDILVIQLVVTNGSSGGQAISGGDPIDIFVLIVEGVAFTAGKVL